MHFNKSGIVKQQNDDANVYDGDDHHGSVKMKHMFYLMLYIRQ